MITIYHNPRCRKSRAGLEFLSQHTQEFQVKEYLKNDLFTIDSLTKTLKILQKEPIEMIRKQEDFYKKEIKGKSFNREQLISLMVQNPQIIQRPIIINETKGILGDPAENISSIV
jgi:arsenate reductase